jgi:hypothetical protein
LGLAHWEFDVRIVDSDPQGIENSSAAIDIEDHYDSATIEFKRVRLEEMDQDAVDRTIVHELLHAAMRDHDEAVDSISTSLAVPFWQLWDNRLGHESEALIERLARTIVALHKK